MRYTIWCIHLTWLIGDIIKYISLFLKIESPYLWTKISNWYGLIYEHARINYCLVTLKFENHDESDCSCGMYFVSRKHETIRRKNWKKKQSMKWRKTFASRQLEEHVVFMFMIEMISLSWFVPPIQSIWCKEHSSHWWEHVVNTTFTHITGLKISGCLMTLFCTWTT